MKKQINEEIKDIKYLFNYNRGLIISEQKIVEDDVDFDDYEEEMEEGDELDFDMMDAEMDEQREVQIPVRPDVDTPTRPKKPSTPYKPKPGVKPAPKARKKDLPSWLTFDELGIEFE